MHREKHIFIHRTMRTYTQINVCNKSRKEFIPLVLESSTRTKDHSPPGLARLQPTSDGATIRISLISAIFKMKQ